MSSSERACRALMLLVGLAGPVMSAPAPGDHFLSYSGTATGRASSKFLYEEHHVLAYRDGRLAERVVLYTCRDGAAFARKKVTYVEPLAPDFLLESTTNGMREGLRTEAGARTVFFRAAAADKEKAVVLPGSTGLVADAGFDEFIRENWQKLLLSSLGMDFLVPSRLAVMGFRVEHIRPDQVEGVPVEMFRLKLSNVLGWFLPAIDVYYTTADHVLVRYLGLSDLRDASGNNLEAQIVFHASDRKPGNEQDVASALRAPLAPCK